MGMYWNPNFVCGDMNQNQIGINPNANGVYTDVQIVVLMKQEKMEQMCANVLQVILIGKSLILKVLIQVLARDVNQVIIRVGLYSTVTHIQAQLSQILMENTMAVSLVHFVMLTKLALKVDVYVIRTLIIITEDNICEEMVTIFVPL